MGQKNSKTSRNKSETNGSANIKQTAAIFKLNIDCFEEIFDYLAFEAWHKLTGYCIWENNTDLVSVGKKCKRLQQVAGYCFQQNYSGRAFCHASHIYRYNQCEVVHFAAFICKISIESVYFRNFFNTRSKLRQLKQIDIHRLSEADRIRFMKISMEKLEELCFGAECDLGENLKEILTRCKNLRRLDIAGCETGYNWLNQRCPTLEYFKFTGNIEGVVGFLELNPNIRKFATTSLYLLENQEKMLRSSVKLDHLVINIVGSCTFATLKSMCDLFNELHKRGFYRKLKLEVCIQNQEQIDQLGSLNGLAELDVISFKSVKLAPLKNLEEIRTFTADMVGDVDLLANELINLRRIYFYLANISDILPFVRQSVELRRIMVYSLDCGGKDFKNVSNVIELRAMNREREQLPNAQKVTLFVKEEIYLATKWALGETDFALIRLKREESFEWFDKFH